MDGSSRPIDAGVLPRRSGCCGQHRFFFIRLADIDGLDVTFWVGVFTALVLTVLVGVREEVGPPVWSEPGLAAARCGFQAGCFTRFVVATVTSVSNVGDHRAPPVAVLSTILPREPSTRRAWTAVALVMVGVLIVVSGRGGALSATCSPWRRSCSSASASSCSADSRRSTG